MRSDIRAWRGVMPGLTEWYRAAESMVATSATNQLRSGTGERNQMSPG
jgi:hypothetical protein